eukprot:6627943-Prymnesium_polylepis.1
MPTLRVHLILWLAPFARASLTDAQAGVSALRVELEARISELLDRIERLEKRGCCDVKQRQVE